MHVFADHSLHFSSRAEKTEVLSEDLLQVEKRLAVVKQVSHSTHKKLTACLQGQQGAEADKRSKKLPLTTLAQCLMEGSAILGDDTLLGKMLKLCGETEDKLAQELIHFELQVERDVIEPLFLLAEEVTAVVISRGIMSIKWQQTSKSSGLSSSLQPAGAKADALREEMEEAANRVEICRDQLSADMYSFVAKEIDYANYFQTLIEVQAEYHRKSLTLLQAVLPQIKAQQEAWVEKPSFGKPLEEHLMISGREIAFPIEACVTMLLECGMQEEVGALKSYLRELPEPLMTFELYEEWIQASKYLIKFLSKLSEYQDVNKMTPSNMAIVLGPNLLWPQSEGNITEMMTTVSLQIVGIIEPIIQHADWFFPGVSKKLAPIPPKVPFVQPGTVSDQPTGQPSPVSLSPTPPSTPSPYGLSCPPGYSLASGQLSPASAPPLASPSVFTSTLAKSRPTPKPRQRPTLPPPQPPSVSLSASSPQSTEHPMLDGMSPGESMSTGMQAVGCLQGSWELSSVPGAGASPLATSLLGTVVLESS
ncbi:Rho GTPase-activating protein RICH2 [Cricetulus griseus]|uniref:Rho GTPase-activating protein RICH2 n=1 Tax=Cricetulus griseus TaxID=10029 RepID=G3GZ49_CRIGR|nr:Rho GTPase-activating protein RICH2 [Cricetulus griseus]